MEAHTFTRGDAIKYISPGSALIPGLIATGWRCDDLTRDGRPKMKPGRKPGMKAGDGDGA
jgi:hypothetical protein